MKWKNKQLKLLAKYKKKVCLRSIFFIDNLIWSNLAGEVKEEVVAAANLAQENASELATQAQNAASAAVTTVAEKAEEVKEQAAEAVGQAQEKASEVAAAVSEKGMPSTYSLHTILFGVI